MQTPPEFPDRYLRAVHATIRLMSALPPFLLFDLDDTLLDYSASGRQCWQELFLEYAVRFGVSEQQLSTAHEQVSGWYWSDAERHRLGRLDLKSARRQVLRLTVEKLGIDRPALGDEMADAFTLRREPLITPFPGVIATLQELQRRGIRMGLVTNGSRAFQRNKIRRFDLERYFEAIIIEGEFGVGKPDRGVFLYALAQMGASPARTWMIGDDLLRDLQPAGQLGLGTVWVDIENGGLPAGSPVVPMLTINSVADLI
jgi:putative hydrolase of the HAD superfamily